MYLVETKVGHPTLQAWKYPLPGDEVVTTIQRVVIHLDGPRVVRLKMPPDQHRSTYTDDIKSRGGALGRRASGARTDRGSCSSPPRATTSTRSSAKRTRRRARCATSSRRRRPTFFESGPGRSNWRYLDASGEIIWFSERDNWGQLYLYDLKTGALKNPITSGEGNASQIVRIDEKARTIWFVGVGQEKGRDPYFRHLYRVGFDGRNQALLTPEDADHEIALSPSGRFFVDSYSKPDVPPVTVLRDAASGKLLVSLEKADIAPLLAAGWKPPIPFTVKARDGVTDLYGLMFRPTDFDPNKKYPIVNSIYPGPQSGSVGSRSFSPARGDTQALAELGSSSSSSTAWGRPTARRSSTRPTTATWATTPSPTRSRG